MIRACILSCLFASAVFSAAFAQSPPISKPETGNDVAMPNALAEFLETAVEGGVLRAPTAHVAPENQAMPQTIETEPQTEVLTLQEPDKVCLPENPIDFQSTNPASSYQDLSQHLSVLSRQDVEIVEIRDLVETYFLLGMFAEAKAALRRFDNAEAIHYRAFADLLEHESVKDTTLFTDLAACHPSANFWAALALIVSNDPNGVIKLAEEIPAFRRLPIRLRIDAAEIALPALRASGDLLTASKVVSAFSSDDKDQSSRLRLQIALYEARLSGRDLPQHGDQLLAQSGSVVPTMRAILAGEKRISNAEAVLLLDRVKVALRRASNDRDVAVIMSFAMQEYATRSDHQAIVDLFGHPRLSEAAPRAELLDHLVAMIKRDLTGDDLDLIFQSISILFDQAELLRRHAAYEDLLEIATSAAIEQRSQSVAVHLITSLDRTADTAALRAEMALRSGNFEAVYELAVEHKADHEVSKFASLAAIREGSAAQLAIHLKSYNPDFQAKVDLIEEDALARHWILPDAIYDSAKVDAEGDVLERLVRLDGLRLAKLGRATAPKITSISQSLRRTAHLQDSLDGRGL